MAEPELPAKDDDKVRGQPGEIQEAVGVRIARSGVGRFGWLW